MTNFPDTNNNSTAPDPSVGWVAGDKYTTDEGVVYTWTGYSWTTEGSGGGGSGAVDSVNGQTGVVSIGVEELDDFAYYPASNQVTLLGPCVGDSGTFSGTEYTSGSNTSLYFVFPKTNTQVYDVLSQLSAGDPITVCFYSSVAGESLRRS